MIRMETSAIAVALACLLCAGCGEDWQAETHPASGQVTINGEPPTGALVHLFSAGEKVDVRASRPWGVVQDDGTFTLTTYETGDGAPAGEYAFTIVWPVDSSVPSLSDRLGYQFSQPEQSKWKFTIKEGDNILPPVEMTNVKVDMNPRASSAKGPPMPGISGNAASSR